MNPGCPCSHPGVRPRAQALTCTPKAAAEGSGESHRRGRPEGDSPLPPCHLGHGRILSPPPPHEINARWCPGMLWFCPGLIWRPAGRLLGPIRLLSTLVKPTACLQAPGPQPSWVRSPAWRLPRVPSPDRSLRLACDSQRRHQGVPAASPPTETGWTPPSLGRPGDPAGTGTQEGSAGSEVESPWL